ncbi:MAG TPA: GRAS family protein [Bacteroidales bacterium]|jgi:SAM-dependent methyltransferase|nr:GRAS family protein [Bacteroidales bacterium]
MQTFPLPSVYEALLLVMQNYPDNFNEEKKLEVEALLDHCIRGLESSSEKFLATLFIKAIRKHIGSSTSFEHDENIYLRKFEVSQIELFNFLINEFPFVRDAQKLVNSSIVSLIRGHEEAVIMDIGIGQGVQMLNLLKMLDGTEGLRKITMIGIEPFGDALKVAKEKFSEADLSFKVEFYPICEFIEAFDFSELKPILSKTSGPLIVNESLALHHVPRLIDRHKVIQCVRALKPKAFFLTEPNTDHFEPDFYKRFQNCYNHYFHIFQVIDTIPSDNRVKDGLKLFFGREIDDVIGGGDHDRSEKHEPAFRWVEKLLVAGFVMVDRFTGLPEDIGHGIEVVFNPITGGVDFKVKKETVLSILQAACVN